MTQINENYLSLKQSYLFSQIAEKVKNFTEKNPQAKIIRLGIGDVTEPLPLACREAFKLAVDEMGEHKTFKGYGPEQGYSFLRDAISKNDYQSMGVNISSEEIFISDGSKCDSGNFQELFSIDTKIAIPDPVYPVYLDSNIMAGRLSNISYLESTSENHFSPTVPDFKVDLIYLCSPNNPTGATFSKEELTKWVNYAKNNKAIILFDAAYYAFISEENVPRSIYEVDGAREVAVEFRSFSKTAGFTGTRCAFTVVPKDLFVYNKAGEKVSLHQLWMRRQSTKFNGVSYPVQKAAEAIYSINGKLEVKTLINHYMENAKILLDLFNEKGYLCSGGVNAPYIWVRTGKDSWQFFDEILNKAQVVATPGVGFGSCGEGHIRFSSFNSRENILEAKSRLSKIL